MASKKQNSKVKVDFSKIKSTATMEVLGQQIEVKSYIDFKEQQYLISKYLTTLFTDGESNFSKFTVRDRFLAEIALRHDIWTRMTNIEFPLVGKDKRPEAPESFLFDDDLFYSLCNLITNWNMFEKLLWMTIDDVERELHLASALGTVVDDLVERMMQWVKGMEGVDLSKLPDVIREMGNAVENSKIASLMDEAQKA